MIHDPLTEEVTLATLGRPLIAHLALENHKGTYILSQDTQKVLYFISSSLHLDHRKFSVRYLQKLGIFSLAIFVRGYYWLNAGTPQGTPDQI